MSPRVGLALGAVLLAGCSASTSPMARRSVAQPPRGPGPVVMPDLRGLSAGTAATRIGQLDPGGRLALSSSWTGSPVRDCASRPRTVLRQRPAPGTLLRRDAVLHVEVAWLDLDRFRGPCRPKGGPRGRDAVIARTFYRFAADPDLGAPFAPGPVWTGLESGPTHTWVRPDHLPDLASWRVGEGYAERMGPFSALDVLAASGGYFEVHRGVLATCGFDGGVDVAPPALQGQADLRAVTLTASRDTVLACMDWWGVTLFVGPDGIRGVALRLGAP